MDDIEWSRDGLHAAARVRATTTEVVQVIGDRRTVRIDSPVARWYIGLAADAGLIVVVADRVPRTRIHQITHVRLADNDEAALYYRRNR